ncbi:MAG: hypothetical protein WCQ50_22175, partial [Spirochaetota bacterium]
VRKSLELDGLLAEARKEVRLLNLELNETTERNISLIEDRLSGLREAVAEADRRVGVLKREAGKRQTETEVYSKLGRHAAIVQATTSGFGPELDSLVGAGPPAHPATQPASQSVAVEPTPFVQVQPRVPESAPPSRRESVLGLYRNGFSADIIANRVGATIAEVELLISLDEGRRGQEAEARALGEGWGKGQ